jgi:plasmid stabilization system protein ParE
LNYKVNFSFDAETHLIKLYLHISEAASDEIAANYIRAIVRQCNSLNTFPQRGAQRDDIGPGIRIFGFRKRVSIAFQVGETSVTILGVFYGGQNFEALLKEPEG